MVDNKRDRLLKEARDHVKNICSNRNDIMAAYIDGSAARNEMIPGSDVDIAIVLNTNNVPFDVSRKIVLDTVMEWCFFAKDLYEDIESILGNAGFTHDLLSSHVLFDPAGWFRPIKTKIRDQYDKPERIVKRAENLLQDAINAFQSLKSVFQNKELFITQRILVTQFQSLLSIPQALLNKPLTNARAFSYCQQACEQLNCSDYYDLLLSILGADDIDTSGATKLYNTSVKLNDLAWPNQSETEIIRLKLALGQYLIEGGHPREAIWPLYFWISWTVEQVLRQTEHDITQVKTLWNDFTKTLGWSDSERIEKKLELIEEALEKAKVIIDRVEL